MKPYRRRSGERGEGLHWRGSGVACAGGHWQGYPHPSTSTTACFVSIPPAHSPHEGVQVSVARSAKTTPVNFISEQEFTEEILEMSTYAPQIYESQMKAIEAEKKLKDLEKKKLILKKLLLGDSKTLLVGA